MTDVVYNSKPDLKRPIMIVAFEGWSDAADAASAALSHVVKILGATPFAHLDAENFYDFTVRRPHTRIKAEGGRTIDWPEPSFSYAQLAGDHDLILLEGWEPSVKWRTFCEAIIEVAQASDVELVVTLGAFLSSVPHTYPTPVLAVSPSRHISKELGLVTSNYEGPTGILGVLTQCLNQHELHSLSLWAQIPFYLQANPSPKAALALLRKFEEVTSIQIDTEELIGRSSDYDDEVAEAVAQDPDIADKVRELEAEAVERVQNIPSGEELAQAFERYLKDLREDK